MRAIPRTLLIALVGALTLTGAAMLLPGCTLLGGAGQVESLAAMPEPEWIAWRTKAVLEVEIAAGAVIEEEVIAASDLEALASILTVIGGTNSVEAGQLAEWLGQTGYKAALLELAILELDAKLSAGGLYEGGLLGPRGKELLIHLGAALQGVAVGA